MVSYGYMRPRKSSDRIENYERVEICDADIKTHNLPVKALGVWAIIKEDKKSIRLRKVRLDGFLMSDKYNNHQVLSIDVANIIRKIPEKKAGIDISKISTRKFRWISDVIFALTQNYMLPEKISHDEKSKIIAQIWDDTNPDNTGGKLYSSVDGALRVWKKRSTKGENKFIEA